MDIKNFHNPTEQSDLLSENNQNEIDLNDKLIDIEEKINTEITPQNFNDFSYSKKSHFNIFSKNNYDKLLYGKEVGPGKFNIKTYQNLLIYAFITQNIPEGSRIIEIGNNDEVVINHFKYRYECWRIEDSNNLLFDINSKRGKIKAILIDGNEKKIKVLPFGYFDFVFSTSAFENLEEKESNFKQILECINLLLNAGGFSMHCIPAAAYGRHFIYHSILNYFVNRNFPLYYKIKKLNNLPDLKKTLDDPDLHFIFEEYKRANKTEKNKFLNIVSINILWRKNLTLIQQRTLTKPHNYIHKQYNYVFHHLMKCGGTSVKEILQDWFQTEYDYLENENNLNKFLKFKLNTNNFNCETCILGHFQFDGIYLHQRYPEIFDKPNQFKVFTFIREPLQFRASLYYYTRSKANIKGHSLKVIINNTPNLISKIFPCDENNYKEVLDRYFFIGIVEQMQESFDKLADLINKKRLKLPFANKSEKDDQLSQLSPEFIEEFKRKNDLDYKIYNYCLEKFKKY